jgi:hypothetical protein
MRAEAPGEAGGDRALRGDVTATSNRPSNPGAATSRPSPVSQYGADDANRPTIDSLESKSDDPHRPGAAAGTHAGAPIAAAAKQRFSAINRVRGLNVAAMAHSISRNTRPSDPSLSSRSVSPTTCQRQRATPVPPRPFLRSTPFNIVPQCGPISLPLALGTALSDASPAPSCML